MAYEVVYPRGDEWAELMTILTDSKRLVAYTDGSKVDETRFPDSGVFI